MKRWQLTVDSPCALWADQVEIATTATQSSESESARHCLFVPLHYEKNYAYPLIVWLHGRGDNERQLKRVMPLVSLRNYVAVSPRGTSLHGDGCESAYCWRQTEADIADAQWRVAQCLDLARDRFHIHDQRVFVGGYDDGGTMALRLALRLPQFFAGAFSIGGPFPRRHAPLINLQNARGLALMLMHGSISRRYSTTRLCEDLRLIHTAGMSVNVREYPCGDELTTQMLSDLDAWLMEQVTGCPAGDADHVASDVREWN
jgi:phospholipase/carboxylesterase